MAIQKPIEPAVEAARAEWGRPPIPMGPIVSLVYRVPEEKRDDLLAYLTEAFPFHERPGGIRMGLYESVDEPGLMLELVAYASETEYSADQIRVESDPEYRARIERWHEFFEELEVRRMRPIPMPGGGEVGSLMHASPALIDSVWRRRWGTPICSPGRRYMPADVEGLAAVANDGTTLGLVTLAIEGAEAELVSLDAIQTGVGHGARLMQAALDLLRRRGVRKVRHFIANDNTDALAFFQKQGFRLVKVHFDAMDEVRDAKPYVAKIDPSGVLLRDLWEMALELPD